MAKTSSAKKAQRASKHKRIFNVRRKSAAHDALKAFQKSATSEAFSTLQQAIDKAAKHGTIKKNTAARMKSRLSKRLAAAK